MIEPAEHRVDAVHLVARRKRGAVDQDHRQTEAACGDQLGLGADAAGVLADDRLNRMVLQQANVVFDAKWATIDYERMVRQHRRGSRRVDKAQKILVLGLCGKGRDMHPSEREHHPLRGPRERSDGGLDIGDKAPIIASDRRPSRPGERDRRHPCGTSSGDRIRAHPRREGVGRVDQMRHGMRAQIAIEALDAAKAADAGRHRLRLGVGDAAGVAERRADTALRERTGQGAGFGGAAKDQDIAHG